MADRSSIYEGSEEPDLQQEAPQDSPQSEISRRLERLKVATVDAARSRERLPQPLFWSLFRSEIEELRQQKELRRLLQSVFD